MEYSQNVYRFLRNPINDPIFFMYKMTIVGPKKFIFGYEGVLIGKSLKRRDLLL